MVLKKGYLPPVKTYLQGGFRIARNLFGCAIFFLSHFNRWM
jgi:hypothetical protein